jgi:hypothetical protein
MAPKPKQSPATGEFLFTIDLEPLEVVPGNAEMQANVVLYIQERGRRASRHRLPAGPPIQGCFL